MAMRSSGPRLFHNRITKSEAEDSGFVRRCAGTVARVRYSRSLSGADIAELPHKEQRDQSNETPIRRDTLFVCFCGDIQAALTRSCSVAVSLYLAGYLVD